MCEEFAAGSVLFSGKLAVYYKGRDKSSFDTWCAYLRYNS